MKALSKNEFITNMRAAPVNLFSDEGLEIIFDYLTSFDANNLKEIEFDSEEIREFFAENYFEEILEFFDIDWHGLNENDKKSLAVSYLKKETKVLGATAKGTVVFQIF